MNPGTNPDNGGERIILLSHGKERAALISIEDLRLLEALEEEKLRSYHERQQLALLREVRQLRESAGALGYRADSAAILSELRQERLDELTDLH